MVEQKLVLFTTVIALWTLVTLLIKLLCIPLNARPKLCHFGSYVVRAKPISFKKFRPGHRAGVVIWENFHPGYRDLGNRVSRVDRAHIKRSLHENGLRLSFYYWFVKISRVLVFWT